MNFQYREKENFCEFSGQRKTKRFILEKMSDGDQPPRFGLENYVESFDFKLCSLFYSNDLYKYSCTVKFRVTSDTNHILADTSNIEVD